MISFFDCQLIFLNPKVQYLNDLVYFNLYGGNSYIKYPTAFCLYCLHLTESDQI